VQLGGSYEDDLVNGVVGPRPFACIFPRNITVNP
jgi:hypothetical protein